MSKVYICSECGLRTTEPFVWSGRLLCTLCAEQSAPEIVANRERRWRQQYRPKEQFEWPHRSRTQFRP